LNEAYTQNVDEFFRRVDNLRDRDLGSPTKFTVVDILVSKYSEAQWTELRPYNQIEKKEEPDSASECGSGLERIDEDRPTGSKEVNPAVAPASDLRPSFLKPPSLGFPSKQKRMGYKDSEESEEEEEADFKQQGLFPSALKRSAGLT